MGRACTEGTDKSTSICRMIKAIADYIHVYHEAELPTTRRAVLMEITILIIINTHTARKKNVCTKLDVLT